MFKYNGCLIPFWGFNYIFDKELKQAKKISRKQNMNRFFPHKPYTMKEQCNSTGNSGNVDKAEQFSLDGLGLWVLSQNNY